MKANQTWSHHVVLRKSSPLKHLKFKYGPIQPEFESTHSSDDDQDIREKEQPVSIIMKLPPLEDDSLLSTVSSHSSSSSHQQQQQRQTLIPDPNAAFHKFQESMLVRFKFNETRCLNCRTRRSGFCWT